MNGMGILASMHSFLNEDKKLKDKYSKILQVLKLDSYMWNLNRIAPEFRSAFRDQIALEYMKANYEGILDRDYFDDARWNCVQMNFHYQFYNANKLL